MYKKGRDSKTSSNNWTEVFEQLRTLRLGLNSLVQDFRVPSSDVFASRQLYFNQKYTL
jgi:hypothetical protein